MHIQNMLARFRPLYAIDDTAGAVVESGTAADAVAAIVNASEPASTGEDADFADLEIEGLEEPAAGAEEYEDFDFDGVKGKVAKGKAQEIQDALMRTGDYTKKTQEIAEIRKKAEQTVAEYESRQKEDATFQKGVFHLEMIDADLKSRYDYFSSPEYKTLQTDDPFAAQAKWNEFQVAKENRGSLVAALQRLQQERNSKLAEAQKAEEADASKRREQLPREIAKIVPGWNADKAAKVKDFGAKLGYAPEALDSTTDPLHYKTLWLASIGQAALDARARKGGGAAPVKEVGVTKMVGQRGGAGTVNTEKMSGDEYRAHYLKQIQAKNARK
jgi:hypothetical protein